MKNRTERTSQFTQSKLRFSPRQFAAVLVLPFSPFVRLHSASTHLRPDDEPHTVQWCKCCNGRACNVDMVAHFPFLFGKQLLCRKIISNYLAHYAAQVQPL
jgi:hypothetical protein